MQVGIIAGFEGEHAQTQLRENGENSMRKQFTFTFCCRGEVAATRHLDHAMRSGEHRSHARDVDLPAGGRFPAFHAPNFQTDVTSSSDGIDEVDAVPSVIQPPL